MSEKNTKIYLYHGENDYLIYKSLKEKKKDLEDKSIEYKEIWGSDPLKFSLIYELLNSASLFTDESVVIIRNISEGNALYDFVAEFQEYLSERKTFNNQLYIFNQGKVAKTTKIYKTLDKLGEIKEFPNPKEDEILDVIHKSLTISSPAATELIRRTNGNLFLIRNEITKLKNYLSNKKTKIEIEDIELLTPKLQNQNEIWGIGKLLLEYLISREEKKKVKLLSEIELNLNMGIEPMMLLYSLYQYILNFIKLKKLSSQGKGFKESMSLGYYFAKDFFGQKDKLDISTLHNINSLLLNYEYNVKRGEIDDEMGLRNLVLSI